MSGIGSLIAGKSDAKLSKLTIHAFQLAEQEKQDEKANLETVDTKKEFIAYYNPNTFSAKYGIEYESDARYGDIKVSALFKKYTTTTYSFSLSIDGTGASIPQGASAKPQRKEDGTLDTSFVNAQIENFKKVAYYYDGETHRPSFLSLVWGGTIAPKCVLTSLGITYDLFAPDGNPLRAILACEFQEYSYRELTDAEKNNKSPDMTHIRTVQQGDKLPLMCEAIYGDARLYLEVARYNRLTNYRNLKPGQKIYFPPLVPFKA